MKTVNKQVECWTTTKRCGQTCGQGIIGRYFFNNFSIIHPNISVTLKISLAIIFTIQIHTIFGNLKQTKNSNLTSNLKRFQIVIPKMHAWCLKKKT